MIIYGWNFNSQGRYVGKHIWTEKPCNVNNITLHIWVLELEMNQLSKPLDWHLHMEFVNEKKKKGTFEHEFMTAFYESWYENIISSPNEKYN